MNQVVLASVRNQVDVATIREEQALKIENGRGCFLNLTTKAVIYRKEPYKVTIKYRCTDLDYNRNVDSGLGMWPIVCFRLGYPI